MLGAAVAFLSAVRLPIALAAKKKKFLIQAGPNFNGKGGRISRLDLDSLERKELATGQEFPHGYARRPGSQDLVVFDKLGALASFYSAREHKILTMLQATPGREFYGHGFFSSDGKLLYSVESSRNGEGAVVVRDGDDFHPVREFPTGGRSPHDALLWRGSLYLCNNNFDRASNLVEIDIASGMRKNEWLAEEKGAVIGHLTPVGDKLFASTQKVEVSDKAAMRKFLSEKNFPEVEKLKHNFPSHSLVLQAGKLREIPAEGEAFSWQQMGFSIANSGHSVAIVYGPTRSLGVFDASSTRLIQHIQLQEDPLSLAPAPGGGFLVGCALGGLWKLAAPRYMPEKIAQCLYSEHSFLLDA